MELLQAQDRDPRRDRLRPRRRRAARRLRGRQPRPRRPATSASCSSRTTRASCATSSPTSCTSSSTAGSSRRAAPSSPTASRPRATTAILHRRRRRPRASLNAAAFTDVELAHRGPTSRSWRAPCATGSRWSTSTRVRPRRSRAQVLDAEREFYERTTPPCTAARTSSPRRRPTPTSRPARPIARFIGARPTRSSSPRTPPRRINLVAYAFTNGAHGGGGGHGERFTLGPGDEVARHRDGAPRQPRARGRSCAGAPARRCAGSAVTDDGRLDLTDLDERCSPTAPRSFAFTHVSNVLGTVNPVAAAHRARARRRRPRACSTPASRCRTCRSTSHDLGVDFLAFSGHKMLGPTGIGVLWGRRELLDGHAAVPHGWLDDRDRSPWRARPTPPPPQRFEAGVPNTAQAIGLAPPSTTSPPLGMDPSRARARAHRRLLAGPRRSVPGVRVARARTTARPRGSGGRSSSTASTPTTSARCSTTAASPSASGTTARGRCTARYGVPATTRATLRGLQHRGRGRRPARRRSTACQTFFGVA